MWLTFVILMKNLVGPSYDKQHSAYGNTAHPLTVQTDLKYNNIISPDRAVNILRLGSFRFTFEPCIDKNIVTSNQHINSTPWP